MSVDYRPMMFPGHTYNQQPYMLVVPPAGTETNVGKKETLLDR